MCARVIALCVGGEWPELLPELGPAIAGAQRPQPVSSTSLGLFPDETGHQLAFGTHISLSRAAVDCTGAVIE